MILWTFLQNKEYMYVTCWDIYKYTSSKKFVKIHFEFFCSIVWTLFFKISLEHINSNLLHCNYSLWWRDCLRHTKLFQLICTLIIDDKFVHSPWAQGCSDGISYGLTGIDVADNLRNPLRGVSPFLQQDDLWLLKFKKIIVKILVSLFWSKTKLLSIIETRLDAAEMHTIKPPLPTPQFCIFAYKSISYHYIKKAAKMINNKLLSGYSLISLQFGMYFFFSFSSNHNYFLKK